MQDAGWDAGRGGAGRRAAFGALAFFASSTLMLAGLPKLAAALATGAEYFLAAAILIRRLLPVAIPLALALREVFHILLPVSTCSITMTALYLAVAPPDALSRFLDRMMGVTGESGDPDRI